MGRELCTESFPDQHTADADHKSDKTDDERTYRGHGETVFGDGESNG